MPNEGSAQLDASVGDAVSDVQRRGDGSESVRYTGGVLVRRLADDLRPWARASGVSLVVLRRVDSTNQLARTLVGRLSNDGGAPRRVLLVAWEQSAGRGRLGRTWTSTAGLGVYATLVLAPAPAAPPIALLPLVAGVGLCRAVRQVVPSAGLKWPNDLVVGGRKLGGILIEVVAAGDLGPAVLIGFGVNHGHTAAELPTPQATSLRLEHRPEQELPGVGGLLRVLVAGLHDALERYTEPSRILAEYQELTIHRPGDTLRCRIQERSIEGRFLDFDAHGRLRVRCGTDTVVVAAGDVVEGDAAMVVGGFGVEAPA